MSKDSPLFWKRSGKQSTYPRLRQSGNGCVFVSQAAAINHLAARTIWTKTSIVEAFQQAGGGEVNFETVLRVALGPAKSEIEAIEFPRETGSKLPTIENIADWIDAGGIVILSLQKATIALGGFQRQSCWHMFSLISQDGGYFETWDTNGYHGYLSHSDIEKGFPYTDGSWYLPHEHHDALYLRKR